MRIVDVIRQVLDLIDSAEAHPAETTVDTMELMPNPVTDELARIKQIAGLVSDECPSEYSNTPQEQVSSVMAVIPSGTDIHASKNPADIRGDHTSIYPFFQHRPGE